jgi:hypothetical protein
VSTLEKLVESCLEENDSVDSKDRKYTSRATKSTIPTVGRVMITSSLNQAMNLSGTDPNLNANASELSSYGEGRQVITSSEAQFRETRQTVSTVSIATNCGTKKSSMTDYAAAEKEPRMSKLLVRFKMVSEELTGLMQYQKQVSTELQAASGTKSSTLRLLQWMQAQQQINQVRSATLF